MPNIHTPSTHDARVTKNGVKTDARDLAVSAFRVYHLTSRKKSGIRLTSCRST